MPSLVILAYAKNQVSCSHMFEICMLGSPKQCLSKALRPYLLHWWITLLSYLGILLCALIVGLLTSPPTILELHVTRNRERNKCGLLYIVFQALYGIIAYVIAIVETLMMISYSNPLGPYPVCKFAIFSLHSHHDLPIPYHKKA